MSSLGFFVLGKVLGCSTTSMIGTSVSDWTTVFLLFFLGMVDGISLFTDMLLGDSISGLKSGNGDLLPSEMFDFWDMVDIFLAGVTRGSFV